jgi:hypothetical protein
MTDNKEPETAVHLEQAMIENARNDTADTRVKVYQELLFSDLLLMLMDENSPNATQTQLDIAILKNSQGTQFVAVFTGVHALRRFRPQGGQYAIMRGQDIFKLLEPSPAEVIVVNPGNSPLAVLKKAEYRQLAAGIVPKVAYSPVQVLQAPAPSDSSEESRPGVQIGFPPNVFNDEQKQHTYQVLHNNSEIAAAAIGAVRPTHLQDQESWIRTIFLRLETPSATEENLKQICHDVRENIKQDNELFTECQFEVGVMPDPHFWESLKENNVLLFDKKLAHESSSANAINS